MVVNELDTESRRALAKVFLKMASNVMVFVGVDIILPHFLLTVIYNNSVIVQ